MCAAGVEAETTAMMETHCFASRSGPQARIASDLMAAISAALKEPYVLHIVYVGRRGPDPMHRLEPHGLLLGVQRYLFTLEIGGNGNEAIPSVQCRFAPS